MQRIATILALVVLAAPVDAEAGTKNIRLSWTDWDTARTMTVSWTSDSVNDPNLVQYGYVAPGQLEVEAEVYQGPGNLGAVHVAHLVELKPGTAYQYRVGEPGNWSGIYTFKTAPEDPCVPFRFAAMGDNRPDAAWLPQLKWNPILNEAESTQPAFFLHTGDIVKDGDDVDQWRDFLDNSDPVLAETPLMATIGNHDDGPGEGDGAHYNRIFAFPVNDQHQTEDYYFFTYGNAIFVSLSSQTFGGGESAFAEQAAWLDQVLTDHPRKWKFVYLHHPPYASHALFDLIFTEFEFNHPPNEQGSNGNLIPIFDKHHVDIVFAGHNHYYERIGPVIQGPDDAEGEAVSSFDEGTVYVITGGAGALVYDEFEIPWVDIEVDLIKWVCGKAVGSKVCAGDHHYTLITIDDNHLHFEARATAQQTLGYDPDNKALIDAFDIYKDPSEICLEPPVEPVVEPAPDIVEQPFEPEVVVQPDSVPPLDVPTATDPAIETLSGDLPPAGDGLPGVDETLGEMAPGTPDTGPEVKVSKGRDCGCRTRPGPLPGGAPLLLLLAATLFAFLRTGRRWR